jgi:hypothetical protein
MALIDTGPIKRPARLVVKSRADVFALRVAIGLQLEPLRVESVAAFCAAAARRRQVWHRQSRCASISVIRTR